MQKYEDLTARQKELYVQLKNAIKNEQDITLTLEEIKKEGVLKEVLTTAHIIKKLEDGIEYNLTPLGYAMHFNNFEEIIKVILKASEDKKEVLTTAHITKKLEDGIECNLTPLGYAMHFNNFEEIIKVILKASEDKKEVLTTANITTKLEGGTEYNLTPLGYAMNLNNFEEIIKFIVEASEDKKEVLTTANITTKLEGGTEYNLTPLGYAMSFNNPGKEVKTILDVVEDNNMLEEVFADVEGNDRSRLQEILKTLKSQEQDEGQKTKIDNWLAILGDRISSCKSNEKPLVPESSVPRTEENIVKTTNKSIMIGSVCGVIAALTVGGGCFAAGIALPILALIGIAVAAFVLTGLVTGSIAYIALKPSDKLDASNTGKFEHVAHAI